jgi:uncharacterized membrane protein
MTDATAGPPPSPLATARPARRWPKYLLIASLALNALLIGAVLRSAWLVRANIAVTGGGVDSGLPAFVNTLPPHRREELGRGGQAERPGALRPLRMEVRRARADAARAFVADPFDRAAFVAAQERLSEAESRLRLTVQRALPDIAERMTAAERRNYLAWRRHHAFGFRRGPGGRGGDDMGPPDGNTPGSPGRGR